MTLPDHSFAHKVARSVCAVALGSAVYGCSHSPPTIGSEALPQNTAGQAIANSKIRTFCSDCHAYPDPETFPKHYWAKEVASGFRFYDLSGRDDLSPPEFDEVVKYYESQAPETLSFSPNQGTNGKSPIQFGRSNLRMTDGLSFPTVSFVRYGPLQNGKQSGLWFCDMHAGKIVHTGTQKQEPQILNTIDGMGFPAHVELCDLDQDGFQDLLIADLGSFMPEDHQHGRVLWARSTEDGNSFEVSTLSHRVGRVADIKPLDADADGDLDLIVAEFGWRTTGRLLLLENVSQESAPRFQQHVLDDRHGSSHVEICDLNGDLADDLVVLISQEFETVLAFINQGDRTFRKETLFEANDPSFGSTGIQVVDLNGDGDLDVLYTNGDMLDSGLLKPNHGVHSLINKGKLKFEPQRLTELPGAYKALAGDVDADGDLDVVACALFIDPGFDASSLIWLEQQPDNSFIRHNLAGSDHQFCTLELGDFDANGTLDIAVGNFRIKPTSDRSWLSFWWNSGKALLEPESSRSNQN